MGLHASDQLHPDDPPLQCARTVSQFSAHMICPNIKADHHQALVQEVVMEGIMMLNEGLMERRVRCSSRGTNQSEADEQAICTAVRPSQA